MNTKWGLMIRDDAREKLRDLYSRAEHFSMSSSELCTNYIALVGNLPEKTPHWVFSYLEGVRDQLTENLYRNALVYGGKIGDSFYSTHRDRDDYYEKHGIEPRDYVEDGRVIAKGHYWRGSLKPFFIS